MHQHCFHSMKTSRNDPKNLLITCKLNHYSVSVLKMLRNILKSIDHKQKCEEPKVFRLHRCFMILCHKQLFFFFRTGLIGKHQMAFQKKNLYFNIRKDTNVKILQNQLFVNSLIINLLEQRSD